MLERDDDILRMTASVRSSVAPSGNCANATRYSLSCVGTNPGGTRENPAAVRPIRPTYRTIATEPHAARDRRPRCRRSTRARRTVEAAEEPAEQPIGHALHDVARRLARLEQPRGERRAQRQRVERRDDGRDRNRQRELAVELAGQPLTNAVGMNTAQSTSAIAMIGPDTSSIAVASRRAATTPLDVPLHVLHHHDRIVDDDADREHEAEERQRVEREAHPQHHGERADQRHGHGDERDDRGAPRLQEHHDDDHDEQNRFEQCLDDGAMELRTKTVGS